MTLYQVISTQIHRLLEEIHQETGISRQDLERVREKWEALPLVVETPSISGGGDHHVVSTTTTTKKNNPVKKSGYQIFFTQNCSTLKRSHPDWTFGDLSREISRQWNALSMEERKLYVPEQKPETVVVPPLPPQPQNPTSSQQHGKPFTFEMLNEMKMTDLRALCESRGLRRTGNKQELIKVIMTSHDPSSSSSSTTKNTVIAVNPDQPSSTLNDETLEVMTSDKLQRTDIEDDEEAIVLVGSEDEGDFVFEDGGSEEDRECDDNEDSEEDQDLMETDE